MKCTASLGLLILLASFLGACTDIHTKDTYRSQTHVQTLAIDAKQRVVVFGKRPDPDPEVAKALAAAATAAKLKDRGLLTVTCAEPSPDALSALSSSLGGSFQDPKVAVNLAFAQAESSASIGLRTQSIQLLRDGMYRLCEGYAAAAIDPAEFNRQQRRYQNLMLSLLAIEQLTGAVVPRQVGLGQGTASAAVSEKASEAAAAATKASGAVSDAQGALKKAQDALATDQKACDAATSDPTNKSCSALTDDKAAVTAKESDLATAKKNEETATEGLQAARGAVQADATGARVSFSDAPKTNQITDGSARYIAEATRTIVSTTLLASFAQEECTRLWDHLDKPAANTIVGQYAAYGLNVTDAASLLNRLAENCKEGQQALVKQASMFTPDYGAPIPPTLTVIGADTAIPMAIGAPTTDLRIVGGAPPYEAVVAPAFKAELEATISPPKRSAQIVHLLRPPGATKSGTTSVIILDSNNARVDIPIALASKDAAVTPSKPEALTITDVSMTGTDIDVKFTSPKSFKVTKFTATAKNTDITKNEPTHSADGKSGVDEIKIPGCMDSQTYGITLEALLTSGKSTSVTFKSPIKCTLTVSPVPTPVAPIGKSPAAPTSVRAKAEAGEKLIVSFDAGASKDGPPISGYSAAATDVKGAGNQIKGVTPTSAIAPITLTGCATGAEYIVTVVANSPSASSPPAKAPKLVTCVK